MTTPLTPLNTNLEILKGLANYCTSSNRALTELGANLHHLSTGQKEQVTAIAEAVEATHQHLQHLLTDVVIVD